MKQKPWKGVENKQQNGIFKLLFFFIFDVSARLKLENQLLPNYSCLQWVYRTIMKYCIFEKITQFRALYSVLIAKDD